MDIDLTHPFDTTLCNLAYSDDEIKSGWNFSVIEDGIIRFQPFGFLDESGYQRLVKSYEVLLAEYFKYEEFLVFIFDFTNFQKVTSEVRLRIIEESIFNDERIGLVVYGMNYFVSTIMKIIGNRIAQKRMFTVKDENGGLEIAKQLISNYRVQKLRQSQIPNFNSQPENKIEINGKSYSVLSLPAWNYNDPHSDYSYKIDLIDDTILVSHTSGYIRYQNSIMAVVLFDKVVNSMIAPDSKYYRIQDYSLVSGSENKARRNFSDYIINGIDKINLVVFFGLNRTMKIVVLLGKLVNPVFEKIRIADTFEDALEQIIADKYKNAKFKEKSVSEKQTSSIIYDSPQKEIEDLKAQKSALIDENQRLINILFDRISKITFGNSTDYVPVNLDETNQFYDLFSAVQLLYEDYNELRSERNAIRMKLQKLLSEQAGEMKELIIDNSSKLRAKDDFIRKSGHELGLSLEAILNAVKLLNQEEKPEEQKSLLEIIKMASFILQDGIGQMKSIIADNHTVDTISDSMFNYRKNIVQLVEVAQMGHLGRNIIFENTIDDSLPPIFIGDKRKFNQLVNIYLENALKFTNAGFIKVSTQLISTSVTQTRLRLNVTDSGMGIDQRTKAYIFNEEHLENEIAGGNNKGFGLLIAKNLARVLDADIGFESEVGVGSKFWFELTLNIGYQDKETKILALNDQHLSIEKKILPFEGKRALIITDDDVKRNLLVQLLRKKGIQSYAKLNYEFFENIEGTFDFVFIYMQLVGGKELNGIKILIKMLSAKNDHIKPIFIGGVDSLIDPIKEEYRKIGVDYFVLNNLKISNIDQFFNELK